MKAPKKKTIVIILSALAAVFLVGFILMEVRARSIITSEGGKSLEYKSRSDRHPETRDETGTRGEKTFPGTEAKDLGIDLSSTWDSSDSKSASTTSTGPLNAAEIDDNENWLEYLKFIDNYRGESRHQVNERTRRIITVSDENGRPISNARVTVQSSTTNQAPVSETLTYSDGRTLTHIPQEAKDLPMKVDVSYEGATATREFDQGENQRENDQQENQGENQDHWNITLDIQTTPPDTIPLDIMFLIDSTGSMSDEIFQIKDNLLSIAQQVIQMPEAPEPRFAMVSYRDREEEYVTRLFDFEEDPNKFSQTIKDVQATGGGDNPESLNEGFHVAVNNANWNEDDPNAVRLTFLIADAPPHLDYEQDYDYSYTLIQAQEKGIKVFAVASSGLTKKGEFIFRQIAQQTMGRFIFLLYPDGEQGSLQTPHDVGDDYVVESLDNLIVRLIREELAGTTKAQPQ